MEEGYGKLSYQGLIKRLRYAENKLKGYFLGTESLKSHFLGNISHETRTPMNGILGFSVFVKEKNLTEGNKNIFINGITESNHKLLRTINNVLETAKIVKGRIELKYSKNHCGMGIGFSYQKTQVEEVQTKKQIISRDKISKCSARTI